MKIKTKQIKTGNKTPSINRKGFLCNIISKRAYYYGPINKIYTILHFFSKVKTVAKEN